MKKMLYYASPFVLFPIIFSVSVLFEKIDIAPSIFRILICIVLFVFVAIMGSLSTANKKFDYIMTAIIPISFFLALFIYLFFDEGCNGKPQLSLHHALNMEYYKAWLPFVAIMMIITFIASFKPIRISKKIWHIEPK